MFKFVYISLLFLSGCIIESSAVDRSITNNDSMPLQHGTSVSNVEQSSVIQIDTLKVVKHQNLTLRLLNIEDSRCATGETCIWAGQLIVTLEVLNEDGEKVAIKLIRKREAEIAYAFGFSLLLLDVAPHPKKGKVIQLSDQTVTLQLEKVM